MSVRGFEMALLCQRVVSQLRNSLRNGALAAKIVSFYTLAFRSRFAAAKWGSLCCVMALVCQEGASQLRKFSQRGAWGCEMISQQSSDFATKWRFCSELVGAAKWFRSKVPISQRLLLGCEISQTTIFPLFLHFLLLQTTFLQFLCNSSWFWSSKNLYYIKTN